MQRILESLPPTGSLPPKSAAPPKAELSVRLEPVWPTIRKIREQVGSALEPLPTIRHAAMMTASELAENAIKYGESVQGANSISFRFERYDDQVRIEVRNGCTNLAAVQELFDCVREIADTADKEALYLARVQRLLDDPKASGKLGLYRIALEGKFELYAAFDHCIVTVTASRKLNDEL